MADEFLKGLGELTAALKDLPGNIEQNALRTGMFRAAQDLAGIIKETLPESDGNPPKGGRFAKVGSPSYAPPGTLKNSIKAQRGRGQKGQVSANVVGVWYARLVEFGHMLVAHDKKTVLGHIPANPVIRWTTIAHADEEVGIVKQGIVDAIQKSLGRLSKKLGN